MKLMTLGLTLPTLIVFFFGNSAACANEFSDSDTHGYHDNYLSLEWVRNHAFSDMQTEFSSGDVTMQFGFHHALKGHWMVGLTTGFKTLKNRESGDLLSILSFAQESLYIVRLYHPNYLLIGPKVMYLQPTKNRKIPPNRSVEFKREIGLGISAALQHIVSRRIIIGFRYDRWRGVDTDKLQAYETGVSVVYSLP